jgi:hypothetical protein
LNQPQADSTGGGDDPPLLTDAQAGALYRYVQCGDDWQGVWDEMMGIRMDD